MGEPKPHRRRRQLLLGALAVLVIIVAAGGFYAWTLNNKLDNIERIPISKIKNRPDPDSGRDLNVLLLGSDKGDTDDPAFADTTLAEDARGATWPVGKFRSDTLQVVVTLSEFTRQCVKVLNSQACSSSRKLLILKVKNRELSNIQRRPALKTRLPVHHPTRESAKTRVPKTQICDLIFGLHSTLEPLFGLIQPSRASGVRSSSNKDRFDSTARQTDSLWKVIFRAVVL